MSLILIIPIIISLAVGAASGAGIVYKWDDIADALQGKKIAVLGARGVGKTTLLKYMETGEIEKRHKQTLDKEEVKLKSSILNNRLNLNNLDIRIKSTYDVSGDTSAYHVWKKLVDESDLIFYVVKTNILLEDGKDSVTEKRYKDDMYHIGKWIKESKSKKQLFIVGNHFESDPNFKKFVNLKQDQIGDFNDAFIRLPTVEKMIQFAGGLTKVKIVLGSLADEKYAKQLIIAIFTIFLKEEK